MACDQRTANVAVARVIPVFLAGLIGYSCFAFTKPLCIDYLIQPTLPHGGLPARKGVGIGLLVGFYILLVLFLASFIRLLATVLWNPGYLPRGPQWAEPPAHNTGESGQRKRKGKSRRRASGAGQEKREHQSHPSELGIGSNLEKADYPFDASGLEAFYSKDVFVCEHDGKPPWCSTCCQYKTDRAHHCREVGRCVRKMDHFCPWVGGVVSETSFKFFIQFLFYGGLFAVFNLVSMAVFVAELSRDGHIDIHYILTLAMSGLLGLFALGMLGSSLQLAWLNSSTIESLNRRTKVWTLAILIPRPKDFYDARSQQRPAFAMVSYPEVRGSSGPGESAEIPCRQFAILHTRPGENPFDLGSPLANLCEVMGYSVLDWLIPLKHSPCADHSGQGSAFALGPVVQKLKREAALEEPGNGQHHTPSDDRETRMERRRTTGNSAGTMMGDNAERSETSRSRRHHHRHHRKHRSSKKPANNDLDRPERTPSQHNEEPQLH